jgi:hypothetical protein
MTGSTPQSLFQISSVAAARFVSQPQHIGCFVMTSRTFMEVSPVDPALPLCGADLVGSLHA